MTSRPKIRRPMALAVVVIAALLSIAQPAHAQDGHNHGDGESAVAKEGRVGLLIADHGEPPSTTGSTYESFREFFEHLVEMGVVPAWLCHPRQAGTIAYDADPPRRAGS